MIFLFFLFKGNITGFFIKNPEFNQNYYTHTKAVCNETNFCQDYEIACNGTEVISTKPITGAVIQHDESWKDPRDNLKLCE